MNFELYTYGGGDQLRIIFNGIVQIFGGDDYLIALKSAIVLGGLVLMLIAAFQKGKLDYQWILGVTTLYMAAVVPKVPLIVTDRLVPANSAVVDNVPIGIAAPSAIMSQLGDYFTRVFETNFSLPNQITYSGNGFLLAHHLIEESTRFEIINPRVATNFSEFWKSCVYYDLLLGLYSWDQVAKAPDLIGFLKGNTSKTRAFTYTNEANLRDIVGCKSGISGILDQDLDAEIESARNIHGARILSGEVDRNAAVARFASAMPAAYQFMTGLSLSATKIISQNILANSLKRGLSQFASEADAPAAAQDFALARAESERSITYETMGHVAKKMLPKLKIISEAMIYAMFPLLILLAMLPATGRVMLAYLKAVFWVNLWAPLYAILHFIGSYWGQSTASESVLMHAGQFTTGLNVMTHTGLGKALSENASYAGYIAMSIPMISWLLIQFSGNMMAGIAGRLISGAEGPVSGAADEASSGNMSLGNTNIGNERAFQVVNAPNTQSGFMVSRGSDGVAETSTSQGSYMDIPTSNLAASVDRNQMVSSAIQENYSQAVSRSEGTAFESIQASTNSHSQIASITGQYSDSKSFSENLTENQSSTFSNATQKMEQAIEQAAKENNVSVGSAMAAAGEVYAKAGVGVPFGKLLGAEGGAGARGSLSAKGEQVSSESYRAAEQALSSQGFSEALSTQLSVLKSAIANNQISASNSQSEGINSAFSQQESASERHSAALQNLEQASKQRQYAESISASITQKGNDGFINYLMTQGWSSDQISSMQVQANRGNSEALATQHQAFGEYVDHFIQNNASYEDRASQISSGFSNPNAGFQTPTTSSIDSSNIDARMETMGRRVSQGLEMPSSLMIDRPTLNGDPVTSKQSEIRSEVATQQDRSAIDNAMERTGANKVAEKIKNFGF